MIAKIPCELYMFEDEFREFLGNIECWTDRCSFEVKFNPDAELFHVRKLECSFKRRNRFQRVRSRIIRSVLERRDGVA